MSEYVAPLKDIRFVMQELAGLDQVIALPGCEEASPDVIDAILDEAAKFAGAVLSPLNRVGDREGAKWKDTVVTTSPGFKEAYRQFVDNGWNGLGCDPEFGVWGAGLASPTGGLIGRSPAAPGWGRAAAVSCSASCVPRG